MDASQVLQSLDSLWFFTDIFTRSDDPLPSLSPPKCDSDTPHSPLLNLQDKSDEIVESVSVNVNVNTPCEPEREVKDRGGGRKRRKRKKRSERHGTRKIELGFDKKLLSAEHFRLNPTSWTLPYDDEIAMRKHLKSWAYAVACIVK